MQCNFRPKRQLCYHLFLHSEMKTKYLLHQGGLVHPSDTFCASKITGNYRNKKVRKYSMSLTNHKS